MIEEMVRGYSEALGATVSRKTIIERHDEAVGLILNRALKRCWKHPAEERINDVRPSIPATDRSWAFRKNEYAGIQDVVQSEPVRQLVTSLKNRNSSDKIELLYAAYWI